MMTVGNEPKIYLHGVRPNVLIYKVASATDLFCSLHVFPLICIVGFTLFGVVFLVLFVFWFFIVCDFYPRIFSLPLAPFIPCTSSALPHFTHGNPFLASPEFPVSRR